MLVIKLFILLCIISLFAIVIINLYALTWIFSGCCSFFGSSCAELLDFVIQFNLMLSMLFKAEP